MTTAVLEVRSENEGALGGPKFSPPLYRQRYAAVLDLVRAVTPKRVIDMGCAECKLIKTLCKECCIEELVGVDLDEGLLKERQHLIEPLTTDYLYPRPNPLSVKLMKGSIAQPDARLHAFDLFICLEVVEHLEDDVLTQVPSAVFGTLQPRIVLITTPNSEFNVLFPSCTKYRHYDHKFEWNRGEFQKWCEDICTRFQYTVELSGVGSPPVGSEGLGCCSQMATFTRCSAVSDLTVSNTIGHPYTLVAEASHPFSPTLTNMERLAVEVRYYLRVLERLKQMRGEGDGDEDGEGDAAILIPLDKLLAYRKVSELCPSVDDLRMALRHSGYVQLDPSGEFAMMPTQVEHSDDDSPSSLDEYTYEGGGHIAHCIDVGRSEPEADW